MWVIPPVNRLLRPKLVDRRHARGKIAAIADHGFSVVPVDIAERAVAGVQGQRGERLGDCHRLFPLQGSALPRRRTESWIVETDSPALFLLGDEQRRPLLQKA